jgi:SH3-like domain-containing protein
MKRVAKFFLQVGKVSVVVALLGACNASPATFPTYVVVLPPTNTLAPILTQTPRFTATPIPSPTPIATAAQPVTPTVTDLPAPDPATATPTPTPPIKAVIKPSANVVNLRSGPSQTTRLIGSLKASSAIQVISYSSDQKWVLVQLDDGSEGWILAEFITLTNPDISVPVLSTADLTQRAELATAAMLTSSAQAPTADGAITVDTTAPTHVPRIDTRTDVLAYCDQRSDAAKNRAFKPNSKVVVFWSWIAKTPEQMKDHLNNVVYNVKVNGQVIGDWAKYSSPVTPLSTGGYITYWFIPLGAPAAGSYKVEYSVTWKMPIYDGIDNFGPGTDKPSETGTCTFQVSTK